MTVNTDILNSFFLLRSWNNISLIKPSNRKSKKLQKLNPAKIFSTVL